MHSLFSDVIQYVSLKAARPGVLVGKDRTGQRCQVDQWVPVTVPTTHGPTLRLPRRVAASPSTIQGKGQNPHGTGKARLEGKNWTRSW